MMSVEYRNAKYNKDGSIDCELKHPTFGWIPFTASANDPEEHGRDIFDGIVANGGVAAYVEPAPVPLTTEQADTILEAWANEVAQGRGYKNADRLLSYQNSTNPTWKAEADTFRAWWDNLWLEAQALLSNVSNNTITAPTSKDELLTHFTPITW